MRRGRSREPVLRLQSRDAIAKLGFAADMTVEQLAAAVDGAEAAVRASVPTVGLIYIEPDLYRETV